MYRENRRMPSLSLRALEMSESASSTYTRGRNASIEGKGTTHEVDWAGLRMGSIG